uniref:Uncharacterized protein n=1 Tax=Oryza brachyantha TaxID=4533 RepID=J3KX97_ORYBR
PAIDDDLLDELMQSGPEDEANDRKFEETIATLASIATKYLDDPDPPSPELLDWAVGPELTVRRMAGDFASKLADFRRGLSVFSGTGRPEEAALRKNAAWLDARCAEATEIVSAMRPLQDKHL